MLARAETLGAVVSETASDRITVPEIARRLNIGRLAVYAMLEAVSSREFVWGAAGSSALK